MLVLTRKVNQTIHVAEDIVITVLRIKGSSVRLGIQAPSHTRLLRGELVLDAADSDEAPVATPGLQSAPSKNDDGRTPRSERQDSSTNTMRRRARHLRQKLGAKEDSNLPQDESAPAHQDKLRRSSSGRPRFWHTPPKRSRTASFCRWAEL